MINLNQVAIADTGFWFALFNERDPYHEQAREKSVYLDMLKIICPWPCLYETVNTRFVRRPEQVSQFEEYIERPASILLDDSPYRDSALRRTVASARGRTAPVSLVDMVIIFIIDDVNVKKHYLLTFNGKDFAEVCARRSIEIL